MLKVPANRKGHGPGDSPCILIFPTAHPALAAYARVAEVRPPPPFADGQQFKKLVRSINMPEPTDEALNHLRQTHEEGCGTLRRASWDPESFEVAVEVEKHRWYWKPMHPKLVLVGESHVLRTEQDRNLLLDAGAIKTFLCADASALPDRFVRLVYCLAYGESRLITTVLPQWRNRGTPPFWDLFGRVTFRGPQPRQETGDAFNDRMQWKVETLREMHRMGIWLLDASAHAIYRGQGSRLPFEIQNSLHQQWWKGYGRHVLHSCEGAKIWVIGKSVFQCLNSLYDWKCDGWIHQPNARDVDLELNWPQLLANCRSLRTRA